MRQKPSSSNGEGYCSPIITSLPQSPLLCANARSNPNPSWSSAPRRKSGTRWRWIRALLRSCAGSTKPPEKSDTMKGLFKSKPRTPADVVRQTRELLIFIDLNSNISGIKREEKVKKNYLCFFFFEHFLFMLQNCWCIFGWMELVMWGIGNCSPY
jgi:hypothetical protein